MPDKSTADRLCLWLTGNDWLCVYHQLQAIAFNIYSWLLVLLRLRTPRKTLELSSLQSAPPATSGAAVFVLSPGGFERFHLEALADDVATVGYNVKNVERLPASKSLCRIPPRGPPRDCAVIRILHSSVNYADVTIRWGLYESALRFVGYPICPGFDFSGVVEQAGADCGVAVGDVVFGITFFGAYSSRVLVPGNQINKLPPNMPLPDAAALPGVAGTALHKVAGFWPSPPLTNNRAVLVHSAAGGVGSMLVQMAKRLGCHPVVAVVGASHKVAACKALGAHVVIDKSTEDLWAAAEAAAPAGYAAIFDANGVSTIGDSYDHLAATGVLVVYGFHTNLPSSAMLSPLAWLRMIAKVARMPKFDPMDLTVSSKTVAGFNLSFFSEETSLVDAYMDQILEWWREGCLRVAKVTEFEQADVPLAHELIQSGQSVGKIVLTTNSPAAAGQPSGGRARASPARRRR